MSYLKIVISGNIVEIKEYEKLNVNTDPKQAREIKKGNGKDNDHNYAKTQKLRKTNIRQIINSNFNEMSKFLTLTFRDTDKFDIRDIKQCNYEFKKFIMRLNYQLGIKVAYVAVIEFQDNHKRGAVHYHMIINMPYVPFKQLKDIWGLGTVYINKIKDVDNLGAYVVKYMNENIDDIRLKGIKAYNMSTGLKKPIEIKSWDNQELAKDIFEKYCKDKKRLVYDKRYHNEQAGSIVYQQYNMTRKL